MSRENFLSRPTFFLSVSYFRCREKYIYWFLIHLCRHYTLHILVFVYFRMCRLCRLTNGFLSLPDYNVKHYFPYFFSSFSLRPRSCSYCVTVLDSFHLLRLETWISRCCIYCFTLFLGTQISWLYNSLLRLDHYSNCKLRPSITRSGRKGLVTSFWEVLQPSLRR